LLEASGTSGRVSPSLLQGKTVAMATFSPYPADPRPRRAVDALLEAGMRVDLICLREPNEPARETNGRLNILRVPIAHKRGGKLSYLLEYSAFIFAASAVFAARTLRRRYDLVHIHNMPDILVLSGLIPKAFGAKIILDMHDPMPELMGTILKRGKDSFAVRLLLKLEKWSMARADSVITTNDAFLRIFASRSCDATKLGIVMNSPDEKIFAFRGERRSSKEKAQNSSFSVMYHGSLVERNGADLAVDALAKVRQKVPSAQLFIYGKRTPFLDKVLQSARETGVAESVKYFGAKRLEEVVLAIEDCDVGIIPNPRSAFTEINMPTRIFEFLALGKPVIAPRTRGICDYFEEGSLLFFEAGNSDDLARQIAYVFSHPAEVAEIVRRGQEVLGSHAWANEKQRYIQIVSDLLRPKAA
jgi:glycosyltransferase involved in cell wall biosynthesis